MANVPIFFFLFHLLIVVDNSVGGNLAGPITDSSLQLPRSLEISKDKRRGGGCSYTVSVRTSCSSIAWTRDRISLAFGDAYGYQVYAPRLDNPSSGAFRRCSTDTFKITSTCTYQICYLYLLRSGSDGWKPEQIKVHPPNSPPVTFYYDMFLPNGVWYGFNQCHNAGLGGVDDASDGSLVGAM